MKAPRFLFSLLFLCMTAQSWGQVQIPDTQNPKDKLSTPQEALKSMKLPDGFKATLFAHEPQVIQPISMNFDERGRLWVCECLTYAESKTNFDLTLKDRIIILEDTNNDGVHDKRTVFWDQGHHLTSAVPGFGGVWVLCAPNLLFIPDKNGDDKPDGEPEVILEGFDNNSIRHNIVNGLAWGPDGWLYGRHGITTTSFVGTPDTPASKRTPINCGIWRFHPSKRIFEVVSRGTTNSWGHDWNAQGNLFFINTVIGHFWHAIPGAYFKRMFGEHFNNRLYELIDQHADHYHWDRAENWSDIRQKGVTPTTDLAGGGHAHCGFMIYQGDNWPEKYRGKAFTCNLHGRRLNCDRMENHGSGFIAKHEPDFLKVGDEWFRGIELAYGPDGGVYILDWSDVGECHENDGVHRNSGRIYKVTYGTPKSPAESNLGKLSDRQLVEFIHASNEWHFRQARRLLQERSLAGKDLTQEVTYLGKVLREAPSVTDKLRALWMLHSIKTLRESELLALLELPEAELRCWGIRLLMELPKVSETTQQALIRMAQRDSSAKVRLELASALQKLPLEQRPALGLALSKHGADASDHNLPLMIWYGMESSISTNPANGVKLAMETEIPKLKLFCARLLTEELAKSPQYLDDLLSQAALAGPSTQKEVAKGIQEGLRGIRKAKAPASWKGFETRLSSGKDDESKTLAREISLVFGDGRAMDEVRIIAMNGKESTPARNQALRSLIESKAPGLEKDLPKLVNDRSVCAEAIRGLGTVNLPETPNLLLGNFGRLDPESKKAAIDTLSSRPAYASALLKAMGEGKVSRDSLGAYHARQIAAFGDDALTKKLGEVWGEVRVPSEKKKERIAQLRSEVSANALKTADLSQGRALFNKVCANCHGLFGVGGNLGPDLTGSQRMNLEYLLENILEPNATVAADYRMSAVALKDGRLLTGLVFKRSNGVVEVAGPTERKTVPQDEIESIKPLNVSPMPENLLESLGKKDILNLFGYLMSPVQVTAPQ